MNYPQMNSLLKKLENRGIKVIESDSFRGVNYALIDEHLIIFASNNGEIAISFDSVEDFTKELQAIVEVWKGETNVR